MGHLGENGVIALWNKVRANFGRSLSVSGATITLKNGAATPTNLSQVTIPDATTSTPGAMSAADKTKLDGVATGANKYEHPTTAGNKHIPSGGSSGQILRWSASGTAAWGADNDTTYDAATTSAAGLMSAADKAKLDGIAEGAQANQNAFTNIMAQGVGISADGPTDKLTFTAGNNVTIVGDASTDTITISATNTTYSAATTSKAGLMSAADKTKLDGIATGATAVTMDQVNSAIASAQVGAAMYQGSVSSNDTISGSNYKKGWYWVVGTAGTYVGESCEAGDMIFAHSDKGGTYSASHFDVVQNNIVEMTASEVEAICTL